MVLNVGSPDAADWEADFSGALCCGLDTFCLGHRDWGARRASKRFFLKAYKNNGTPFKRDPLA